MTLVLVHGVPEADGIWHALIAELGRTDVVTLSPPGFGAPVPVGFGCTAPEYTDWLIAELEHLDEPVDLVGHDWGGGHALGVATKRPDLIRRLVTDIGGCFDTDYVWHDLAQLWQTPEQGEAVVEMMNARSVDEQIAGFVELGMSAEGAGSCAEAGGPEMGAAILALYRSAVQPYMSTAGNAYADLTERPPTLVIAPSDDHYTGGLDKARRMAGRWGAEIAELDGLGHWWMMEDPARGAAAIGPFLS